MFRMCADTVDNNANLVVGSKSVDRFHCHKRLSSQAADLTTVGQSFASTVTDLSVCIEAHLSW